MHIAYHLCLSSVIAYTFNYKGQVNKTFSWIAGYVTTIPALCIPFLDVMICIGHKKAYSFKCVTILNKFNCTNKSRGFVTDLTLVLSMQYWVCKMHKRMSLHFPLRIFGPNWSENQICTSLMTCDKELSRNIWLICNDIITSLLGCAQLRAAS